MSLFKWMCVSVEDESPSLAPSTLVLLASAVLTSICQVFNWSVCENPKMQKYLLRHSVFAVAGHGEAKRVSLWERVGARGASLWQDSAAGRGAGASAEELRTRWLLAPAPALAGGQPASRLSIKHGPACLGQIRAGPAPSRPVLRRGRPGLGAEDWRENGCLSCPPAFLCQRYAVGGLIQRAWGCGAPCGRSSGQVRGSWHSMDAGCGPLTGKVLRICHSACRRDYFQTVWF